MLAILDDVAETQDAVLVDAMIHFFNMGIFIADQPDAGEIGFGSSFCGRDIVIDPLPLHRIRA